MLGAVGNHLPRRQLGRMEQAEDIDPEKFLVVCVVELQEGLVAVDPCAWDADVQCVVEVGLEGAEAGGERIRGGYVDSIDTD